jgi:methylated-DNA-[protein]-cysteine S-methyltransferase
VERPGGAIAVGQANARNPLLLVVPCHRVLASGNKLGGYGPGVEVKRWLLRHEGVAGW